VDTLALAFYFWPTVLVFSGISVLTPGFCQPTDRLAGAYTKF
jgi:hypothetical protein